MRCFVLSLMFVASVGVHQEANAELVCVPGPAMSCVDITFIQWTEGNPGTHWAGDFVAWRAAFAGSALFDPSHVLIVVAIEQLLTGSSILCTSAANPELILSGEGPATCSFTLQVHDAWVQEGGVWTAEQTFRFYTGSTLRTRGPMGSPVDPSGPPVILGLAAFVEGEDGPEGPVAVCGGGFFGPWGEIGASKPCASVPSSVPEPGTALLLGSGLLGLGFLAWRKKEED